MTTLNTFIYIYLYTNGLPEQDGAPHIVADHAVCVLLHVPLLHLQEVHSVVVI
jgi:hypothetical protein